MGNWGVNGRILNRNVIRFYEEWLVTVSANYDPWVKTGPPSGSLLSNVISALQGQSWIITTETVWPSKPQLCTMWPFRENIFQA